MPGAWGMDGHRSQETPKAPKPTIATNAPESPGSPEQRAASNPATGCQD